MVSSVMFLNIKMIVKFHATCYIHDGKLSVLLEKNLDNKSANVLRSTHKLFSGYPRILVSHEKHQEDAYTCIYTKLWPCMTSKYHTTTHMWNNINGFKILLLIMDKIFWM
jgi:hypothetical protein